MSDQDHVVQIGEGTTPKSIIYEKDSSDINTPQSLGNNLQHLK